MNHKSSAKGIMTAPNCQFSVFPFTVGLSPIRWVMKPLSRSSEVKGEMLETMKKAAISNPFPLSTGSRFYGSVFLYTQWRHTVDSIDCCLALQ
jgi:hypothetical protein